MRKSARSSLAIVSSLLAGLLPSSDASAGGAAAFQELPNAFGVQPCGGGGCYTNYLRVADLDGDGDLDVVMPNDGGAPEPLVIYENDGAAGFTNASASAVDGFVGRVRQVALGDIDADGDLDLYAPDTSGGVGSLFINDGAGAFVDEGDARLPPTTTPAGSTRMGDLDGDGDLDIVVANHDGSGDTAVYLNDGDGNFDELAGAIAFDVGGDINDIDLFDADRDFDLDLLTNAHFGDNRIWLNDGTGTFAQTDFASSGGLHYGPGICDVDGDADLDIWIDNQGPDYTERLWRNDGDGGFTDVTVAQVHGNPGSDDNGIVCADTDSDGDLDAVVVALGTPERLLENDGTGDFTYVAGAFSGPVDSTLWAEMGDLDGDRRIDIVTGQGESGSFVDRVFLATDAVPVDGTAPRILVQEDPPAQPLAPGESAPVRFAVTDDALSDGGPRLTRAFALIDPRGAALEVPASFVGGDLFRVALPSEGVGVGSVTYRLCAEDPAGNVGCGADAVYDVEGSADSSGGSSSGSSGGDDGVTATTEGGTAQDGTASDGADTTAAESAGDSADSTGAASTDGSSGSSGDATAGQDSDGGCGCTSEPRSVGQAWLWILLAGLGRRRRSA